MFAFNIYIKPLLDSIVLFLGKFPFACAVFLIWQCVDAVKNLILALGPTRQWFSDKQKLFVTSQIMKGKSNLIWIEDEVCILTFLFK